MAGARRQLLRHVFALSECWSAQPLSYTTPHLGAAAGAAAGSPVANQVYAGLQHGACSWSRPTWHVFRRHQSTTAPVQHLLDAISATQLREALADEAEIRPFMANQEFLQFIKAQKAADDDGEAQGMADALAKAGVVLRFNGMVYLRPQEVSELVFRVLPTDPSTAQRSLADVEAELAVMDAQHKQIYTHAQRWPRRWLYAGCAALATQLVGFAYLTWWELSWDVMEPVAYIVSLSYSLLAYVYFLATRGSYFDQKEFKEYWEQQQLEKRMAAAGFDLDRYQHLMRTRDRCKRYMSVQAASKHQAAGYQPLEAGAAAAAGPPAKLKES